MTLVAALAVVFETVPWLRGTVGNVLYFALWMGVGVPSLKGGLGLPLLNDPLGIDVFRASLYAGANAAFPNETIGLMGVAGFVDTQYKVFNWPGLAWTPGIFAGRWSWAVLGLGLILLSSLWFARFDPSKEGLRRLRVKLAETKENEPLAALTGRLGVPAEFSLESVMGCGVGACWGCVHRIKGEGGDGWVKICEEGPVFPGERVLWPE